jgi:glycosyltransferase involved in cell wall biosynthesis
LKRILFVAHHRLDRSPGQRYRFEQFFNHLNTNGNYCHLANILDERDDAILYSKGNYFKKFRIAVNAYRQRWHNLREIKKYDLIVLYREAILTRSTFFERKMAKSGVPIIFDFDDAIWVKDVSAGNRWLSFMKNADKIRKILPLCTHVTAGNEYLAEFARQYNNNVSVFPSTIDIDKYVPSNTHNTVVTIGWVGSHTTVKHFELVVNVYKDLKKKYGNQIAFKVIGDPSYRNEELDIIGEPWRNEREVELFNSIDIGVMPLDEDPWTKGKCGMKGLLYMSVGKPAVMSAVGMNSEIIEHGVNGFIPVGEKEWYEVLCLLIEDPELRKDIGARGRQTIIERYSYQRYKDEYVKLYNRVMEIGKNVSPASPVEEKVVTFRHENNS